MKLGGKNEMIKALRNERGITLTTLIIALVMMIILMTALSVNSHTSLNLSKLTRLQNDIEVLNDKVAIYYVKHGEIPKYKSENTTYQIAKSTLQGQIPDLSPADGNIYYVLDIGTLQKELNMSRLNYGKGWQSPTSQDRYIINGETHMIYYIQGVHYEGEEYHTIRKKCLTNESKYDKIIKYKILAQR